MKFRIYGANSTSSGLASIAVGAPASPTANDAADVHAAQATTLSKSPTSHIKGKAFDRYVSIWFENTDYDMAAGDRRLIISSVSHMLICELANFQYFAKKGITLSNKLAVTHPSEPNYMAAVGGYGSYLDIGRV